MASHYGRVQLGRRGSRLRPSLVQRLLDRGAQGPSRDVSILTIMREYPVDQDGLGRHVEKFVTLRVPRQRAAKDSFRA